MTYVFFCPVCGRRAEQAERMTPLCVVDPGRPPHEPVPMLRDYRAESANFKRSNLRRR